MKKFPFTSRPVLALALASFAAGFFSPPSLVADPVNIVWDTGPFCADCETTNIVFTSVEQFDSYTNAVLLSIQPIYTEIFLASNRYENILAEGVAVTNAATVAYDLIPSSGVSDQLQLRYSVLSARGAGVNVISNALDGLESVSLLKSRVDDVRSSVLVGAGETRALVATACESSEEGCCCQCPDYTSILQAISSSLNSLNSIVNSWALYLVGYNGRGVLPFLYSFAYGIEEFYRESAYDSPIYFASDTANAISNISFAVSSLAGWLHYEDPFQRSFFVEDPAYSDPNNIVARGIAGNMTLIDQAFGPYSPPSDFDNGVILGFRDFWQTRNVHPTNTADNPLWVSLTNDISFSDSFVSSLSLAITNGLAGSLISLDWDGFIDALNDNHLYVNVTNVVTVRVDRENERSELEEILDSDVSDPNEDTVDFEDSDFSPLSDVGSHISSVFDSYKSMFTSIPDAMPTRVLLHPGWSLGGIDVVSLHWELSPHSRFLASIRGVFSALWAVSYLLLIWFFAAVDIFVVGVCCYMVYGLLSGHSHVALAGMRKMFSLFCGFLGLNTK